MKRLNDTFTALAEESKKDWDWIGAVTGMKRRGKSSLTFQLAELVSSVLESNIWISYYYWERPSEEDEISEDRAVLGLENTNLIPASAQYALKNSTKGDIIWIDEAVNIVQKYRWNTPECKDFISKNEVYGWKNLFIFMLQPEFNDFTKGFRTSRLKMHIWVRERGNAVVRIPKETIGGVDWRRSITWTDDFPQLPQSQEDLYRRIKEHLLMKKERAGEQQDLKDYQRQVALHLLSCGRLTQKQVSACLGIQTRTLQRWKATNDKTTQII